MGTPHSSASLTIVIATAGRRESLQRTLAELGGLPARGDIEVVVVDNAPEPQLSHNDLAMLPANAVRLLYEPTRGKAHALNRALAEGVGQIVAVLDDDMSPMPGWAEKVITSVESRRGFDIFGGRSHVIWPEGVDPPAWAEHWLARGLAFSAIDWGDGDREMGVGNVSHPSGNHFWFRRTVLDHVATFPAVWATEPGFVAAAFRSGHRGVFVPEVSCGHRIQRELVDADVFIDRAERYGRAKASFLPRNRLSHESSTAGPAPSRMTWRAKRLLWWLRGQRARWQPEAARIPAIARSRMESAYYDQLLHDSNRHGRL